MNESSDSERYRDFHEEYYGEESEEDMYEQPEVELYQTRPNQNKVTEGSSNSSNQERKVQIKKLNFDEVK